MLQDTLKVTGAVSIVVTNKDGQVVDQRTIPNLVVNSGKAFIASAMKQAPTFMSHLAIGSDNSTAAAAQANLGAELGRVALTSTTVTDNKVTYVGTLAAGVGTGAVTEAGIFNSNVAGTMLCRTVFPVVNKGADDSISISWEITIS
jgi:hypothetical protein